MELDKIMQMLKGKTEPKLVRFVSDKGKNSCRECLKHHNQIFAEDDKNKPEIPIHPNCRCKYEYISAAQIPDIKESLREVDSRTAIWMQKLSQLIQKQIEKINALKQSIVSDYDKMQQAVTAKKMQSALTAGAFLLKVANQISAAENTIKKNLEFFYLTPVSLEQCSDLEGNIREIYSILRELHYARLNDPWQAPDVLPKSPEEALKAGFVRAKDSENRYHINKGETDNVKYVHKGLGLEIIFDKNGKRVTTPENIGTLNYGPDPKSLGHVFWDVLPYWFWGNSPQDTTPLWRRIYGTDK